MESLRRAESEGIGAVGENANAAIDLKDRPAVKADRARRGQPQFRSHLASGPGESGPGPT
jgi:hypothetical protein